MLGGHYMAALGPSVIPAGHLFDPFRIDRRQVLEFRSVGFDVIQLPVVSVEGHQLPLAQPNRAVAFVLPEKGGETRLCVALQNREQAPAFQGQEGMAFISPRMLGAGHFQKRGQEIGDVTDVA